jgi:hypothetical protein
LRELFPSCRSNIKEYLSSLKARSIDHWSFQTKELEMIYWMTEEKVFENSQAEGLMELSKIIIFILMDLQT